MEAERKAKKINQCRSVDNKEYSLILDNIVYGKMFLRPRNDGIPVAYNCSIWTDISIECYHPDQFSIEKPSPVPSRFSVAGADLYVPRDDEHDSNCKE